MNNIKESYYKEKRNLHLQQNNKIAAIYFQSQLISIVEDHKFFVGKKNDLLQQWEILYELMSEVLGIYDELYFKGICYEISLAAMPKLLSGNEEKCRLCNRCFVKSDIQEYTSEAYRLHIQYMCSLAWESIEEAQRYADNILKLFEIRYGYESYQYARLKLHILGDYIYNFKKNDFVEMFESDFEYYKKYLINSDPFFMQVICFYIKIITENKDIKSIEQCTEWSNRCDYVIEANKGNELYNYIKCQLAWIESRELTEQQRYAESATLLDNVIERYLLNDDIPKLFYGYVYLQDAYNYLKMFEYNTMFELTKTGLEICRINEAIESELYYSLYFYVGVKYIHDGKLKEASELFSKSLKEIAEKFGTENDNYKLYRNNLKIVANMEGRNPELI